MKGLGIFHAVLGISAICAGLAIFGHAAGWPVWGLGLLWVLGLPAVSAVTGLIAGRLLRRR